MSGKKAFEGTSRTSKRLATQTQSLLWVLDVKLADFLYKAAKTMQSNRGQGSGEDLSLSILFATNLLTIQASSL